LGGAASVLLTDGQLVPLWRQELGNFPPTVPQELGKSLVCATR
jgi:hypothetical protein